MKDLTALRKIAEQATPGPWETKHVAVAPGKKVVGPRYIPNDIGRGPIVLMQPIFFDEQSAANATHIATFDPPTVLSLLTRLEQAEAAVVRVREVLEHHTFVADDKYGDLAASQYYGDSEVEAVAAKSITRALAGDGRA